MATTVLVPYEVYELTLSISAFKVITLVINLAVVIYLLFAKRLFGLRGGHQAEQARRDASSGWGAIERATTCGGRLRTQAGATTLSVRDSVGRLA